MKRACLFGSAALAMFVTGACGNKVDYVGSGGQGPGGSGGSGAGGGTSPSGGSAGTGGSLPPDCAVETSVSPPFAVTFRFTNPSGLPLYLKQGCNLAFEVTSCVDDYAAPLSLWAGCTVDCEAEPGGCIQCGPCWEGPVAVTEAEPAESEWAGHTYTFGTNSSGCACSTAHVAPAAHYRVSAPVYESEQAVEQGEPSWEASVDFVLPAPGAVVEVPLVGLL